MATKEEAADWAWLPGLLLHLILQQLSQLSDVLRLGAVCKPWRKAMLEHSQLRINDKQHLHQLPLLMIPTPENSPDSRSLYSITSSKIYDFRLPIPYNRRCCGCSHGWLAFPMEDLSIILMNPFTGDEIHLPKIMEYNPDLHYNPQFFIQKVILSQPPNDQYEVAALYGSLAHLAIIRPGQNQKEWSLLRLRRAPLADINYYRGQLYAVDTKAKVCCFDTSNHNTINHRTITLGLKNCCGGTYLVETSGGELLIVRRFCLYGAERPSLTKWLKAYKLVHKDPKAGGMMKLKEVKSIGDDAFFLGDNQSISALASDVPGCRKDSIYYTDDCCVYFQEPMPPYERRDFRRYSLSSGKFKSYYKPNPLHKDMPPPIWITPTLCGSSFGLRSEPTSLR